MTGLAESIHFARAYGLDMEKYLSILNAGQLSSPVSRVKAPKMIERDFAVQASIQDVLKNNRLISDAARQAGISSPLLDICHILVFKDSRGRPSARRHGRCDHGVGTRRGAQWTVDRAGRPVTPVT